MIFLQSTVKILAKTLQIEQVPLGTSGCCKWSAVDIGQHRARKGQTGGAQMALAWPRVTRTRHELLMLFGLACTGAFERLPWQACVLRRDTVKVAGKVGGRHRESR